MSAWALNFVAPLLGILLNPVLADYTDVAHITESLVIIHAVSHDELIRNRKPTVVRLEPHTFGCSLLKEASHLDRCHTRGLLNVRYKYAHRLAAVNNVLHKQAVLSSERRHVNTSNLYVARALSPRVALNSNEIEREGNVALVAEAVYGAESLNDVLKKRGAALKHAEQVYRNSIIVGANLACEALDAVNDQTMRDHDAFDHAVVM
mmetsp:Transcript_7712/g.19838  ORF Transcript_7712/g.19838 Transcript_7712/m.19838 type:complete len:206 (+) Transcript_7712:281-898(+)